MKPSNRDPESVPTESVPILVSARRAAAMLSICARTLWTLTRSGEIESVRIGRAVRYRLATLEAYAARLEGKKAGGR